MRAKSESELRDLVGELKRKQFDIRFDRVTGKLENYRQISDTKRKLAVVLTLLNEKIQGKGGSN
jgi:large subunit ribosomal protein L29